MTPRYDLDLTQVQFEHRYGDITLFGTWFGQERRPALVLVPTAMIGHPGVVPCVVPLKHAWMWSKLGDPAYAVINSYHFANSLGLAAHDPMTCMRITTVIQDNLGELLKIPPKPTERTVVADAIRVTEDGREQHSEVTENV